MYIYPLSLCVMNSELRTIPPQLFTPLLFENRLEKMFNNNMKAKEFVR